MGTWGVGPFDNDDAADMIAKLTKSIQIVEARKDQYRYNEVRAAAQFILLAHGTDVLGGPGLLQVVRALARIRSDAEWIGGFRTPNTIANALEAEIQAVVLRMHDCKKCPRVDVREATKIADEAARQPVSPSTLPPRRPRSK